MRFLLLLVSTIVLAQGFQPGPGLFRQRRVIARIPRGGDGNLSLLPSSTTTKPPLIAPLPATTAETPAAGEPWTKPRLHNNPLVRSGAILVALALAGFSSPMMSKLPLATAATVHMLSFATWFGTVFYTTFIAGLTMFKALPRQTFGKLQSKLFPKYFSLCSLSIVLQIITLNKLPRIAGATAASRALLVSLVMTLLNQFVLEPKSTKIMFDRYELENSDDPKVQETDEYKALKSSFGKLHGMSSLTNLIALCGAAIHGVCLSAALIA